MEDFGDTDYIEYRLEQEIKNQFVTRKQSLLKTLYTYIAKKQSNQTEECFGLYGTNSFNLVWEKICAELFCNVYDKAWKVSNLAEHGLIDSTLCTPENKNKNISDYIERPEWKIDGEGVRYSGDLIPDIISLRKEKSGNCAMYILDGKYYLLSQISFIAVLSSPSMITLAKAGIQIRSIPIGARYPRAIAIALIA